ncbi:diacylglycerol acyltransferase type 2B [Blakeslea trispora]|nr:diacylglycerol acyltransferase type 2B [Blakeslea trispora]
MAHIRWAPLRVPFERRLQTAAILTWIFLLGNSLMFFCWTLCLPFLWPLHFAYLVYMIRDRCPENGGRRSEWFRQLPCWRYFVDYFPIQLVKEADLDPKKNYIFGYHPHGIISLGAIGNFGTEATGFSDKFPGIFPSLLTLTTNFNLPIYREIILAMGLASVSRHSCEHILSSGPGRSIVIVIGGAAESLSARPGITDLTLKKRLGFIRMAIRHGADLVPTFSFGENDLYQQVDNHQGTWLWKIQKKMQHSLGFTVPLFHARGVFNCRVSFWFFSRKKKQKSNFTTDDVGLIPYRHPVVTVVGKPISVPKLKAGQTEPTEEQLKETQALYIQELESIYNKYKDIYAKDRKQDMQIVS